MTGSDPEGEYDGEVHEIPFQRAWTLIEGERTYLQSVSRERLRINYDLKGDGWQKEEPRYHFWKGMDELFSACHHADAGELKDMDARLADGLNHLFMASYLAHDDAGDEE